MSVLSGWSLKFPGYADPDRAWRNTGTCQAVLSQRSALLCSDRMCLVRMRQEGRAGKYMCRYIVHSMWEDVEQRSKIMGVSIWAFDSIASWNTLTLVFCAFCVCPSTIVIEWHLLAWLLNRYLTVLRSSMTNESVSYKILSIDLKHLMYFKIFLSVFWSGHLMIPLYRHTRVARF